MKPLTGYSVRRGIWSPSKSTKTSRRSKENKNQNEDKRDMDGCLGSLSCVLDTFATQDRLNDKAATTT